MPGKLVLDDISLSIPPGEFVVLVGASGCGKTTLLKTINRLIMPESGEIFVDGRNIDEWNTWELRRSIGYVIQQIGLFPHMTVAQNVAYVPRLRGMPKPQRMARAAELIELVGLEPGVCRRYPRQLSGGQGQRVGVARALAADPAVILMDEPFGAVDDITRRMLQQELKSLHGRLGKTVLFVTHDIGEALTLADRVVLLNGGKIEQVGTPHQLVFEPASEYVRSFFGAKGLRASLDEKRLEELYEEILAGRRTPDSALGVVGH